MSHQDFIIKTLSESSKIALKYFGQTQGQDKPEDANQVLTEADLAIGKYIGERISEQFPGHNSIDEEAGIVDQGSDMTWVIDPIDGTSNFAQGVPTYGLMIGLLHNGQPVAGGIALPAFGEIYVAEKGLGAWCNNRRIHVSTESQLLRSLVAYGIDGHQEQPAMTHEEGRLLAHIVLAIRNLRTSNSVFDAAMVASGKYGASLNRSSKIWDNVAQHILIEEAGGIYTDYWGQPIDYSQPLTRAEQDFTWCAGSPALHEQLQKIIHSTK